jgi:hypothetical protein
MPNNLFSKQLESRNRSILVNSETSATTPLGLMYRYLKNVVEYVQVSSKLCNDR